jgi:hypothetical protein
MDRYSFEQTLETLKSSVEMHFDVRLFFDAENGLQKLLAAELPHFDTEVNRQRITRIKDGAKIQCHFLDVYS